MKTRSLMSAVGTSLILGMLAAWPAQAGNGLIKITHANPPYRGGYQCAPAMVAHTDSAVYERKAPEVQVAVMATSLAPRAASRSVYIHR
ncbi:MAG TPA: hypothetical protein VK731_11070 [Candidatus Cybelea sp.]|nr:hypothetical protein [Candidatus Cybelea sp.]